ncbi:MAG: FAD-dependent oxidoreductase [Planctomycetota bacterium]|jgi:electron transfer flavoprotein-quinone oxidoreductase
MEQVDTIIVGAGLAGLACACRLAKADPEKQVLVLERGDAPGAKNVSGGRLYLEPVRAHAPETAALFKDAPLERSVCREQLTLLDDDGATTLDFLDGRITTEQPHSVTILRSVFDAWLGEKATKLGAYIVPQSRISELLRDGNKITGVRTEAGEEIGAPVVVAADGVLSFTSAEAGLREGFEPNRYAVAAKEILTLDSGKIEDRFNLEPGEGAARLFAGDITGRGLLSGGFCYTNRESISLGIVVGIGHYSELDKSAKLPELFERFKSHPEVKRLIAGAKPAEYSAHVIPEVPEPAPGKLATDGLIVCGDAAGFALNLGITVRGMDFAIISGEKVAEAIIACREKNDFSKNALLDSYLDSIRKPVLDEIGRFSSIPEILTNPRMYTNYPEGAAELMRALYSVGDEKAPLYKTAWPIIRKYFFNWRGFKDWRRIKKV